MSRATGIRTMSSCSVAGGPVYYTAQATGEAWILDPATGKFEEIALGP